MPTHKERRERVALALAELAAGGDLKAVAVKYGYEPSTLQCYRYTRSAKQATPHSARRERMAKAVLDVSAGIELSVVAAQYGYAPGYLRNRCARLGVSTPLRSMRLDRTLALLAMLLNDPNLTHTAVAKHFGISRQRVRQIRAKAESAGIRFPGRRTRP